MVGRHMFSAHCHRMVNVQSPAPSPMPEHHSLRDLGSRTSQFWGSTHRTVRRKTQKLCVFITLNVYPVSGTTEKTRDEKRQNSSPG